MSGYASGVVRLKTVARVVLISMVLDPDCFFDQAAHHRRHPEPCFSIGAMRLGLALLPDGLEGSLLPP